MANNEKDDVLFEQLKRNKQRRRRKTILTVAVLLVLAAVGIFTAMNVLRAKVRERVTSNLAEVKTYQAKVGRISTTVSGSGTLESVDSEQVAIPDGVEVEEVLASVGDSLKEGDAIASVKVASVMTVLSQTQETLDDLDKQIRDAQNDNVSSYMGASLPGRVKRVYAQKGDNVVDVMSEHGALALVSLDGLMTVTVDAELVPQSKVTVVDETGKSYEGTVETGAGGRSTVTLTDDGPAYESTVTVFDGETEIGSGTLEIHNPLAVTGYAGTISYVNVQENQRIYTGSSLFSLNNTGYSGNYDALLQNRTKAEKTMNVLIGLLRTGAVCAPFEGTVSSVDYSADLPVYTTGGELAIVTMAPDEKVCVNVGIDETDILSLALGQNAEVTVSSVSDDPIPGVVTEISKVGVSNSGVTQYSAVVTLDKLPKMLSGMSASVDIQIQGVDDVVLIPVDALHQTRNTYYVFTEYDEENKQYGGRVEVKAGASNSSFVEIVSGLQPGDTVYYTEKTNNNFFNMMGMGGMTGGSRRNNGGNNGGNGGNRRPGNGG